MTQTTVSIQPVRHPAPYNKKLFPVMASMLWGCHDLLDPMAGEGNIFKLRGYFTPTPNITAVEIEPDYAKAHPEVQVGDALHLDSKDDVFDAIGVSPAWANRLADHHNAKDGSRRITYKHCIGHDLHPNNGGQLQWGPKYRAFITQAWTEARRVLQPGGRFVLDIGNHIRGGVEIDVAGWMKGEMVRLGYHYITEVKVKTGRLRYGRNHELRIDHEFVMLFRNDK